MDGQLEKKEKGKEEKNDFEAVIFPCRAIFYHTVGHRTYVYHAILDKIVRNEIVGTTNKQNVLWYYEFSLLYLGHAYSHPLQLRVEHTCK